MALDWVTGFEYGLATPVTNGGGLANTVAGTLEIQGSVKKTGSYALKTTATVSVSAYLAKTLSSTQYKTISIDCRIETLGGGYFFRIYNGVWLALYTDATGYLYWYTSGYTSADSNVAVTAGEFFHLDILADGTNHTIDWQINGTDQTQYGWGTVGNFTEIRVGHQSSGAYVSYYDNVVVTTLNTDYPLSADGAVEVEGLHPDQSNPGSSNPGTNNMYDNGGTLVNDSSNPPAVELDKDPFSVTLGTYIKQTAGGAGDGHYAEVLFDDTAHTTIIGGVALLQYQSAATQANAGTAKIIDEDSQATNIFSGDMSETSMQYKMLVLRTPNGGWDQDAVNALKAQVGFATDVNPVPYWCGLLLEIAYIVASGVTLTVADGMHVHTVDSPVLTQLHNLTVQEVAHVHTVDSPVLTQAHTLVVNEAAHVHTVDSPVLVQDFLLAVSEAFHVLTSDVPTLTEYSDTLLVVADSFHAHVCDSPVLTQVHLLSIDEILHGHTVDSPVLAQTHVLVPSDIAHALTSDTPDLESGITLVVSEGAHPLTSEAPVLVQNFTLAVNESQHGLTSDPVVLTQAHILTVSEIAHVLTSDNITLNLPDSGTPSCVMGLGLIISILRRR